MSCLFEVLSQHPDDGKRIWLVVAADAGEAGKFVPDPYHLLGCQAIAGDARGPSRLIGWVGPSRLPSDRGAMGTDTSFRRTQRRM